MLSEHRLVASRPFRFDPDAHQYSDPATNFVYPSITGLLKRAGWIDDRWYTEASRQRGTAVHVMAAAYDLDGLDPADCVSPYRGYLLGYVALCRVLKPEHVEVEVPRVHPHFNYAGRPDRVSRLFGAVSVPEIKSGAQEAGHAIQTALQAILVAEAHHLPPRCIQRYGFYLKANGKYAVEEFRRGQDFDEAERIIARYC